MKHTAHILMILSTLLLLVSCGRGEEMRAIMAEVEQRNQDYQSLADDTIMRDVVRYMDRHGTPNDRMKAHYLLGSVYRDRYEAPNALECFQDALDCADTTAADCDYKLLCRVHAQMADLLFRQALVPDALINEKKATYYAWMAKDSVAAILAIGQQASCYHALGDMDSTVIMSMLSSSLFEEYGDTMSANTQLAPAIYVFLTKGDYEKAKDLLYRYEYLSHLSGQEVFKYPDFYFLYHYKGLYYLGIEQYDSSAYYFRRQIDEGQSVDHRHYGSRGLYLLYKRLGIKDSITKYADLSYDLKDSSVNAAVYENMQNMESMYSYNRYQRIAREESDRASAMRVKAIVAIMLFLVSVIVFSLFIYVFRLISARRISMLASEYALEMLAYSQLQSELKMLKDNRQASSERIKWLERELECVKFRIAEKQEDKQSPDVWDVDIRILDCEIVRAFHSMAASGKTVSDEEWNELRRTANLLMPNYMNALHNFDYQLSLKETNVCILVKLRFVPSELCTIMNMKPSAVSNMRRRLHQSLFHQPGKASMLDEKLRQIRC